MRRSSWRILLAILVFLPAASPKRSARKSPHVEIVATARVETAPQRIVHRNYRSFEELEVVTLSFRRAPEGDAGGDPGLAVDTSRSVHVVHDLTCGGRWVELRVGDRLEVKGEYVHPPDGEDLIHFTHPAGAVEGCGQGHHPDGYLEPLRAADNTASVPARPAPDLFVASVRPILVAHCSPCHEKGGKMYARLPFDQPATLSTHADGARKRLKGEDLAAFEKWLGTLSASGSSAPGS